MKPKTNYRKQIEEERCNRVERMLEDYSRVSPYQDFEKLKREIQEEFRKAKRVRKWKIEI